jgi:hypothetical protein
MCWVAASPSARCIEGSGFRVQGSGFRVQGSGFRVQGSGFRTKSEDASLVKMKKTLPAPTGKAGAWAAFGFCAESALVVS